MVDRKVKDNSVEVTCAKCGRKLKYGEYAIMKSYDAEDKMVDAWFECKEGCNVD